MNKGELLLDGTPKEIFTQVETLKKIGLDTPQISRLMARLHETNPQIPAHIFTVEEAADVLLGRLPCE
jgi:energy-coupling factor transport system ATP-binding protein